MDLSAILHAAQQQYASDVHFDAGSALVYIRSRGQLQVLAGFNVNAEPLQQWLIAHINAEQMELLQAKQQFDFTYNDPTLNLRSRLTVYFSLTGVSIAARLLTTDIPTLSTLGAPQFLLDLSPFKHGLVLLTGATGSGKSTTLASFLAHINQNYPAHIVTLEDPIEYIYPNQQAVFHQAQKDIHFKSYAQALSQSLRRDPDVIVVGELRDIESIEMALRAAETGHLVIATLHSSDATHAITRLVDAFPANNQYQVRQILASVLLGVVAQRLVSCSFEVSRSGRIATFESLMANAAVKNLIKEGADIQLYNLMQTHAQQGMFTFKQHYQKMIDAAFVGELKD